MGFMLTIWTRLSRTFCVANIALDSWNAEMNTE